MNGVIEYHDDDLIDRGFCPKCGAPLSDVTRSGKGFCEIHGDVWAEWKPPRDVPDEEEDK